jgi:phenylalanyl-tRNA synthetase alpha chain
VFFESHFSKGVFMMLLTQIEAAIQVAYDVLGTLKTVHELEQFSIQYFGRKGIVAGFLQELKNLSVEEKRLVGPRIQEFSKTLEERIAKKREDFLETAFASEQTKLQYFDVTASVISSRPAGNTHLYTKVIAEVQDIFLSMGFDIWEGPEVETDFYNFTALNIPADHPARDMQDTFWLSKEPYLLRTHTSSVQVHAMESKPLPLMGISVGRVFRQDAIDASHDMMFTQCEGLIVDKGISLANLFGIMKMFLQTVFDKKDLDIRIRPGFFPFVEPGVEIDMRCVFCKNGCKVCKQSTWIEMIPGGLVHPNVLKNTGINPSVYSGIAFGLGIERLAMLRHQINDIRLFHSGKVSFLTQF